MKTIILEIKIINESYRLPLLFSVSFTIFLFQFHNLQQEHVETEFDLDKDEEEFKNSMQSSIASARWESIDSANDRDLGRFEEETLRIDFLLIDNNRKALTTLSPRRLNNLAGEKDLLTSLNVNIATTTTLLLLPLLLPLPPCFSNVFGLSSSSGLEITCLIVVLLNILDLRNKI